MTIIEREQLKEDEVYSRLKDVIKSKHVIADHTRKALIENEGVKDFCAIARHFVLMEGKQPLFIHYDTHNWIEKGRVLTRIDSVGIYDDFMEYEGARVRGLHGGKPSDIPNVN